MRISQLMPKHTTSIVMSPNSNPLATLQQFAYNRSEVSSPLLHKSSRLSNINLAANLQNGLKIIRETRRENAPLSDNRSMTASQVSCNK